MQKVTPFVFDAVTIAAGFAAAGFWFKSACVAVPKVVDQLTAQTQMFNAFAKSLHDAAYYSQFAAVFSGVSMLFLALATGCRWFERSGNGQQ